MNRKIGITMGDPKGIGPEIILKALNELRPLHDRIIIYINDKRISCHDFIETTNQRGQQNLHPISDSKAATVALSSLEAVTSDVLSGKIDAIVTAPVNKRRIQYILSNFTGHTSYLAKRCKIETPVMMFIADKKHRMPPISVVTTHKPIKDVPKSITPDLVHSVIKITSSAVTEITGTNAISLAVTGLNPHAGEYGLLGNEESEVIVPAMERARNEGIPCQGPFPADAVFAKNKLSQYDGIVAMYHDQAMVPTKLIAGVSCVNITLGLPFIRTSPGHGTAEDIAGQNIADPSGMILAIQTAFDMPHDKK